MAVVSNHHITGGGKHSQKNMINLLNCIGILQKYHILKVFGILFALNILVMILKLFALHMTSIDLH